MRSKNSGAILFLVVIFSFIMSAIGMAIIYMSGLQMAAIISEIKSIRAVNLSDAGIEAGKAWVKSWGASGCFPEHHALTVGACDRNAVTLGPTTLESSPTAPVVGNGYYTVSIDPYNNNNVADYGGGTSLPYYGVIGNYLITSTGLVSTGVSGSYDVVKISSVTVRVSTTTAGFVYRIVANSYEEQPISRQPH